ncbi:MAG: cysteine hydrolase [Oscillospiraceae bacterium]|nr:cysteine hydrolase [Oscillospiraceae bacterium]
MKKALIVIDMQNDFITGALGSPQAREVVPKIADKIRKHLHGGGDVFFTRDTHGENYLETAEGRHLPVPHCLKDSEGWQISAALTDALGDAPVHIFDKTTFGSLDLARFLSGEGYGEIELAGLVASICVVSNALILKAHLPETAITVDAACTAGVGDEDYLASLCVMRMCHIGVISGDETHD